MYDTMNNSGLPVDPETIEEYIKSMSLPPTSNNLIKKDQLAPQLIYSSLKPGSTKANTLSSRSVILVPTSLRNALLSPTPQPLAQMIRPPHGLPPPYPMILPPGATLPPPPPSMVYRGGMTLPHKRPTRFCYASHRSQMASMHQQQQQHRHHPHPHSQSEINGRHSKSHRRNGHSASDARRGQHQRCKSDTDADNRKSFPHNGLDKKFADSFHVQQEQANGNHIDYSSSRPPIQDVTSTCHNVAM